VAALYYSRNRKANVIRREFLSDEINRRNIEDFLRELCVLCG
jgi:hypothetical protein